MALREIGAQRGREPPLLVQAFVPAIGDWREMGIDRLAQRLDCARQRIAEIFVLAAAKRVTLHDDAAAESFLPTIERSEAATLLGAQQRRGRRVSALVE